MARFSRTGSKPRSERGYILLTLLLVIALIIIVAGAAATSIAFQIRRDKEEELVHRGVQYSRAIRAYVKKTGRYPVRLEDLQEVGGLKFLRKKYKDPITGKDFKLLHMSDVTPVAGIAGATNLNATAPDGSGDNPSGSDENGAQAASDGANDPANTNANPATTGASSVPAPTRPTGVSSNSGLRSIGTADTGAPQGLLICGVASTSKSPSIREFNHKNHYNDWLFFYNPTYDRGTEIKGPTSLTPIPMTIPQPGIGQTGQPAGAPNPAGGQGAEQPQQ